MNNQLVSLDLKTNVALPQIVMLTAQVAHDHGVDRRFKISARGQRVPAGVAEWLYGQARYRGWFTKPPEMPAAPTAASVASSEDVTGTGAGSDGLNSTDEPITTDAGIGGLINSTDETVTTETGETFVGLDAVIEPGLVEPWSDAMTVPALREYAQRHGVELTSADNKKDDIKAKLAAAGLPKAAEGDGEDGEAATDATPKAAAP